MRKVGKCWGKLIKDKNWEKLRKVEKVGKIWKKLRKVRESWKKEMFEKVERIWTNLGKVEEYWEKIGKCWETVEKSGGKLRKVEISRKNVRKKIEKLQKNWKLRKVKKS